MHCVREIAKDCYWVGGSDRRLQRFENLFPVPRGITYNAYLLMDEKNVLLDTVDRSVGEIFFENLAYLLGEKPLDYVVVNHMEPDHCATLLELCRRYPRAKIVCNAKSAKMIGQFFSEPLDARFHLVNEGDTLSLGLHTLRFLMAPMVHWPEVMVTYEQTHKILFSADAFGTFGAFSGNLFADEVDFAHDWLPDARRYYANIVGKYGPQVQALLQKVAALEISFLCPLHGPIWRNNIAWYVNKYQKWSRYEPEENAVMIVYGSIYGHTENAANLLATKLAEGGVSRVALYDVSGTHDSVLVAEAFRVSHIALLCPTYNAGLYPPMEHFLSALVAHNLQNRTMALVQNGTWAPTAENTMRNILSEMKDIRILEETVTLRSALKEDQQTELSAMAAAILASLKTIGTAPSTPALSLDPKAFFTLSYGLFVLTARNGEKDNGCIVNTVLQVTDQPKRIAVAVNKQNFTQEMIRETGLFNVSVLSTQAPFPLFQRFGFQSGRTVNKFNGYHDPRSANGLRYIAETANAFFSAKVVETMDCGTHMLFLAEVTEAQVLNALPSATYAYYFEHIKPKPQPKPEEKPRRGYVCKICGYFHEGETLPPDFVCPVCKHGAEDFEAVGF